MEAWAERFWAKVDRSGECWVWTAGAYQCGYGKFQIGRRTFLAHRLAYVLEHGEIPSGKLILHKCDNGLCVRPDHLFAGTHVENMHDMVAKGRSASGERNPHARLTPEDVRSVRAACAQGGANQSELARKFGVFPHTIWDIANGKTWKGLLD